MKSLRGKMTVLIVLVVLVSSGLLCLISYLRARDSMSSQMEDSYSVAADKYALELTAWFNTNATVIDTMAAEITVSGVFADGYDAFHAYLAESCALLNTSGSIYDIYFTYPDNTMACASDFVTDGTVDYVHGRDWFTVAAATGELFYSTPYLDSDSGKPIVTISKAVFTDGELRGVLAADIFVDVLVKIISEADVAPDSYAFLVDQNLGMIAHPDPAWAFEDEPLRLPEAPDAPYAKIIGSIRSGSRETVYLEDYDGVTRGVAVSRMPNTGWYVGIATSRAELTRSFSGLSRGFLIAVIIAMAIGVVSAVFLSRIMDRLSRQEQEYEARVLKLEKQAADEASEAKSRFLADMSHEIRTPINAMLGMDEVILREAEEKEIRGYARNIRQSGRTLLQLVNSILDFSRIESGKMEILPVRYSVRSLISSCVNAVSERARAKNLDFVLKADPSLPSELYGDETRVGEVITNLLTNAVKYTEKGSVTLTVEIRGRGYENNEKTVLLYTEVRDTGIGIKEEELSSSSSPSRGWTRSATGTSREPAWVWRSPPGCWP